MAIEVKRLFLQNWIDSNLLFVKDLRFDRGKLDVTNIWAEIFQVKNSLSKYSTILSGFQDQIIRSKNDMTHIGLSRKQITWTTKEVYNEHIENIFVKPKLKILSGRENLKNTSNNEIIVVTYAEFGCNTQSFKNKSEMAEK